MEITRTQYVGLAVGAAIALTSIGDGPWLAGGLRLIGYPLAVAAIVRFIPIVRRRMVEWFILHEVGVAAIVAGWALVPRWTGVIVNGSWGVSAAVWYWRGGRGR